MVDGMGLYRNGSLDFRSKFNDGRLGVLARRDFRRFYIGYSTSLLGTALSSVAIAFAVLSNGGTPTGLGVVFAANIVPMVAFMLGGLLALGRRPRRPLVLATLATLGFPLPPLALALHLPAAAVAGGALLAGLGSALGGALSSTVEQERVPAQALSRVGAFNLVGAYALGPVAFVAAGPAAAAVGARAVLGFGAAWAVLGPLAVLAVPSVRRMTWLDTG
jgi:MFS family permease